MSFIQKFFKKCPACDQRGVFRVKGNHEYGFYIKCSKCGYQKDLEGGSINDNTTDYKGNEKG